MRNANITIEKKIIAEKNVYRIGDDFIFRRRFLVISVRRRRLVSSMFYSLIRKVRVTVQFLSMVYPKTLNLSLKRDLYISVSQDRCKVLLFFCDHRWESNRVYNRGERENIRGYIRRKILSTLFSNDTDFTAYL